MSTTVDILSFNPALQTSLFEVRGVYVTINSPSQRLIASDPQRVLIAFFYPVGVAAGAVGVWPGDGDSANLAIQIPSVDRLEFKYADYGATVGMDWYGYQTIPGATIGIMEVVYRVKTANRNANRQPCSGGYNGPRRGSIAGKRQS